MWVMKNNAWVTVNNDFGVRVRWFANENHRQIAPWVTQKSLLTVTNALFYFLHAIICPETHSFAKNNNRSLISPLSPKAVFSDLALWRHYSWSMTSRECGVLALWRHIRRLFLRKLAQRRSSLVNNSREYRFLTTRYSRLSVWEKLTIT